MPKTLHQVVKNDRLDPEDRDKPEEELREVYRGIAERRVRLGLVLSAIGDKGEVNVTREELNRAIMEEARRHPGQEQKVIDFYSKNPQALASLQASVFEEKVVDHILASAKVTDVKMTADELIALPEDGDEGTAD